MIDISDWTGLDRQPDDEWFLFPPMQIRAMPLEHREQFEFLDGPSTKAAYTAVDHADVLSGDVWGNNPFAGGCYASVERFDVRDGQGDRQARVREWLRVRNIDDDTPVLVVAVFATENMPALLTTWEMICTYADAVFSGDNLVLVPPSTRWCLYYHHDDILSFATDRRAG